MWELPIQRRLNTCDESDRNSARPLSAPAVEDAIRTPLGVATNYKKPDGRYGFVNPELVARNRRRQADLFCLMLEAESSFEQTFTETESAPPQSFIRNTTNRQTLKMGGTK